MEGEAHLRDGGEGVETMEEVSSRQEAEPKGAGHLDQVYLEPREVEVDHRTLYPYTHTCTVCGSYIIHVHVRRSR